MKITMAFFHFCAYFPRYRPAKNRTRFTTSTSSLSERTYFRNRRPSGPLPAKIRPEEHHTTRPCTWAVRDKSHRHQLIAEKRPSVHAEEVFQYVKNDSSILIGITSDDMYPLGQFVVT